MRDNFFTTFESGSIFGGSWGSIEQTTMKKFSLPRSLKRSIEVSTFLEMVYVLKIRE